LADSHAAALKEVGVEPEDRVFVAMPDGDESVAAFFGILKIGAVVVMLNPALAEDRVAEPFEITSLERWSTLQPMAALPGSAIASTPG